MSLRKILQFNKTYLLEFSNEIARRNLKLMKTVCYCGLALFVGYYGITFFFFRSQMISPYYGLFVPVLVLVLVEIQRSLKCGKIAVRKAQLLTILMYLTIMAYCIAMSVFAHPELYSVYFPLFLILGPVMFILPMYQQVAINTVGYAAFVYFVVEVKAQSLWMHDLFESFTALMFSFVAIVLMTQFRVQSDDLKNKYYSLSRQDGLTGILNKTTGIELIRDIVESPAPQEPYALILLDVDNFKKINDTYGHEIGDLVLRSLGEILSKAVRPNDIVSRYGGDEFLLLLNNSSRQDSATVLAVLERRISRINVNEKLRVSCSIGVYADICGVVKFEEALKNADDALYFVKQHGKCAHRFFDT